VHADQVKGPDLMLTILQALLLILGVIRFFVIAHFIMSWLIRFEVLNIRQEFVGQVWYGLERVLDPIYSRVRRIMPDLGGIDLSPIVVLVGIEILRIFLINNLTAFV
jgi:YggT family protein